MSKALTSVATMILYEEGKFELSDPVSDYLPQFEDMKVYVSGTVDSLTLEAADPVPTVHDLIREKADPLIERGARWGAPRAHRH